ncbi:MAG: hypothetical protein JWN62_1607 [Acidimicrobiales bacterium]|nr:hypothetical protein [Acidimicrobiales bacterium]
MRAALDLLHQGTTAVAGVAIALVGVDDLGPTVLAIQMEMDRLRVVQSRVLLEADRHRIWKLSGHRSIEDWFAAKGKTTKTAASKQRKLGEALNKSKDLADAVDAGEISPDTASALLPALDSGHSGSNADLVDACKGATPGEAADVGNLFREWHPPDGLTDAEREHAKRQRRGIRFSDLGDGMTRVDGQLTTTDAMTVENALRALTGKPLEGDDRTREQKNADALVMLADAYAKGEVRGGRERPTVVVTIDIDVLEGRTPGAGRSSTGQIIPAEIVRQMCTNANIVRLLTSNSVPLDMGRSQRLASNDQFKALLARDGGCRFEGCNMPADWCQVDHIQEWDAQNGPTDLNLLVLWCVYHHSFRHRPDVHLHGDANNLSITLPDGRTMPLPARGPTTKNKAA